ncbi:MAG TPA: hydantoinase B/oxoprolinase family protein, partial [Acetobacteraceae bacterium]|nr:hydantoinase B/oxoprolinase family protein [Acetobacteraceae bacterium]
NAIFDRVAHPPKGRDGGLPGAAGRVALASGVVLRTKGFQIIPEGDRLVLELPGGGGMGDPSTRAPAQVARDVRDGLVSVAAAQDLYKVAVSAGGAIDAAATEKLRG